MSPINTQLSDRALRWVIDAVHPEANVRFVQQLQGGVSSLVFGVSLFVGGEQKDLVLRQFDDTEWLRREPDLVLHEAMSLHWASRIVGVQTPEAVAYDDPFR